MIVITVNKQDSETSTYRFEGSLVRIGREVDNDLVLDSVGCSRHHAEIREVGGIFTIVDLGSTNGLVVGGKRVSEYPLSTGTSVVIGEHTLNFEVPHQESKKTVMMPIADLMPEPAAAKKPGRFLYLRFRARGGEQNVKIVEGADYVVGRAAGADLVLDDPLCSSRHAVVRWEDGRCMIRDADSANGTFVNGTRVGESEIRPGDRIKIGQVVIFIDEDLKAAGEEDALLAKTQIGMPTPERAGGAGAAQPMAPALPKWVIGAIVAAIFVGVLGVIGWRILERFGPGTAGEQASSEQTAAAEEAIVRVAPVLRKDLTFTVSAAGTVKPQRQVTLSAEVAARVVAVAVGEGETVRNGTLVIRLDDREIRLQMEEAASSVSKEQVELAREDFERTERLFTDGAATRSALDQAKNRFLGLESAWRTAQARLAQLRSRLDKTLIKAPLSGVVVRTTVESGEFVGPGTPLAVIEDTAEVLVLVEVADRDVVRLRPLHVVDATTDAYPGRIFQGVVERVSSAANPVTRAFEVEARVANPGGELRSGMITSITVVLDKRNCLVVPDQALLDDRGDRARVYLVSDGIARSVEVGLGGRKDREVELTSGLSEGDSVVVFGHDGIRDGQAVRTY